MHRTLVPHAGGCPTSNSPDDRIASHCCLQPPVVGAAISRPSGSWMRNAGANIRHVQWPRPTEGLRASSVGDAYMRPASPHHRHEGAGKVIASSAKRTPVHSSNHHSPVDRDHLSRDKFRPDQIVHGLDHILGRPVAFQRGFFLEPIHGLRGHVGHHIG